MLTSTFRIIKLNVPGPLTKVTTVLPRLTPVPSELISLK